MYKIVLLASMYIHVLVADRAGKYWGYAIIPEFKEDCLVYLYDEVCKDSSPNRCWIVPTPKLRNREKVNDARDFSQ